MAQEMGIDLPGVTMYLCGAEFDYHLGADPKIQLARSPEELGCTQECSIVQVEVKFKRLVQKADFSKLT